MYYWDNTYLLVILGMIICGIASISVKSAMKKYHEVMNERGISGMECARRLLDSEGLYDVQVLCLPEGEGDHYDPRNRTVNLSEDNYYAATVTAMSVAAHECGHAIQHAEAYAPLTLRTEVVPTVNLCNTLSMPIIILGAFLGYNMVLIRIGIIAFSLTVLFQLITLPVELNASRRALMKVDALGLVSPEEEQGCRKVLKAAAFTYVAAATAALLQLLRLVMLFGGRDRD